MWKLLSVVSQNKKISGRYESICIRISIRSPASPTSPTPITILADNANKFSPPPARRSSHVHEAQKERANDNHVTGSNALSAIHSLIREYMQTLRD